MASVNPEELAFAGAGQQARLLAEGAITAPALVDLYLNRITELDPMLRCFRVVMAGSARVEAAEAQSRIDAGERLPLLGVPIAIKDDVDVAGEVTAYGSAAHGSVRTRDAEVVRRLRGAGAVVLGKTAVPEMMIWPFTETVAYGATRNPYNTDFTPGGSSGGSAAAVAAGLVPLALGSDGMGSIRIPATWCGLFGIKPQRDRVPLAPHDDAWNGLSVNGPVARTVEDAALFLDATTTLPGPDGGYVGAARRPPGRLRIALSTKVPPPLIARVGRAQRRAVSEAGELLRSLGHEVVERDPDYPPSGIYAQALPRYFRGAHDDVATLPQPARLDARTRSFARIGGLISDRRMRAIRAAEGELTARVLSIFDDVDVVITPGTAAGPSRIGAYQRRGAIATLSLVSARVPFQAMFNVTGQPAAVVPWDQDASGIPTSIQMVGRPCDEETLVSLSAQIEQARPWGQRRPAVS
ncbi:putative amidase AmiB2 [Mycolicibacterium cyprinidarum]|uniref:amidase n=1 Tax=Mycolicibacterium cyprinidarum TaxID=2860311 RepID=A0ABQ4VBI0_9MYCO|nr:putative amidase AmiB2 [Mycolicibacterium sp. NGTWSNA01]GJF17419.1 putative amidase AmiB2 [Mycolicibacterium sp. NGTWS0302]